MTDNTNEVQAPANGIASMLEAAKAFQQQMAAFAEQSASARKAIQEEIAAIDQEKASIDGPHKELLSALDASKAEAQAEYKAKVDGLLSRRQELSAQLQQLVAAGVGAPIKTATTATSSAGVAGSATRNSGVKEFVFGILETNPTASPDELARECAAHYGNESTSAGTCNGLKVAFKKLNPHLYV